MLRGFADVRDNVGFTKVNNFNLYSPYTQIVPLMALQELARETLIWSKLDHPNILPLLGYYTEEGADYPHLISEWMEAGTLTTNLKYLPSGLMTVRMVSDIMLLRRSD